MHSEIKDSPWWILPGTLFRGTSASDAKFEDYVKDLPKVADANELMISALSTGGYLRGTMFETEHAYISATNKKMAAFYLMSRTLGTAIGNLSIKVDENVEKVMLTIGNTNIWEKKEFPN